ncbi:unnamed protein product [Adineta steineri]|nr:unnamed protein product [Adineta steineri]
MGIRLAKEDEMIGLDATAHGESWEVATSRAFSTLVREILDEHNNNKQEIQENGTFSLQYTAANQPRKSIAIPIPLTPTNTRKQSQPNLFIKVEKPPAPDRSDSIHF